ncbi:MAG: DUF1905 domain-containing protein [Fimbriimonas sp.]
MILEFSGTAISWRGPAPFVFVPVPPEQSAEIKAVAAQASYGWGVIPALVTIGSTEYRTSLFPREGIYLVPIKVVVQKAEKVEVGDELHVRLEVVFGSKP